jgi:hypothetical protein
LIQKEAVINNIPHTIKVPEIFTQTIKYIMENIDIWDSTLQFAFAKSLRVSIENILISQTEVNMKKIILMTIKFFVKTIANEEKNLSNEYIKNFSELIEILSERYRLDVPDDIIESSISLGSFGKPSINRRYCVFFCTCLIRVSRTKNIFNAKLEY